MLRLQLCFAVIALLFCSSANAQNSRITGKVSSSENNAALADVSVSVKGTTSGTSTNPNGDFSVTAALGATLIFSYVGYDSKEVVATKNNNITVLLTPNSNNKLSEVVVIGYGTQKKREQTAAISTVSGKDIVKSPVSDATNSLIGRVPGLFAQQRSGRPGINVVSNRPDHYWPERNNVPPNGRPNAG